MQKHQQLLEQQLHSSPEQEVHDEADAVVWREGVGVGAAEDAGARESASETEEHTEDGEELVEENAEGEAINKDGNIKGSSDEEEEVKDEDSEWGGSDH